ncbi:MAG: hypothetical protein COV45_07175 [Deltaproteobacteria bacterium CG11_big_fil_rev_8_21_14_0_20_47_16]|nr:MAG: hypothetical protein COV45_07175 [Deltaproteobacteria bacterium CG11_big_fil_rev_8_21_14_0_20_47_16]
MATEPFKWNLKIVSEKGVAAVNALYSFLPSTGVRDNLSLELRKVLMQHLGNDSFFVVEAVDIMPCREWLSTLPDPSIVVSVGMTPLSSKILIHVDHVIAHHMIDRLLGGDGDVSPEARLITDAEGGVLQYLCMQVLMHLHSVCGRDERVHFRFEQILQRTENIVKLVPVRDEGVVMTVRLGFGDHLGFVRILFPDPFVSEAMVEPLSLAPGSTEQAHLLSRMNAFGDISASVWAEAGVVTIHPDELKQLEVGDVVLLDESDIRLKGGRPDGNVHLRVGMGQHGGVRARIQTEDDILHCKIEHIDVGG